MRRAHTHTPQALAAARVLGLEIARGRRLRKWTAEDLAERCGVSRLTLRRIERGDPTVALGTVFEAAVLTGVALFAPDPNELDAVEATARLHLALLPQRVRDADVPISDAF